MSTEELRIGNTKRQCELVGEKNRFGVEKTYTCTSLPVYFIHKPISEWMCSNCAINLLRSRGDFV